MSDRQLWTIPLTSYASIKPVLCSHGLDEDASDDPSPERVFVVSQNRARANEMVEWCHDTGIPARVRHSHAMSFVELFDGRHDVIFKIRWA